MRICMVQSTPFPPEEGIGYYVYNLSQNLIKRGHEITVITRGSYKTKINTIDGINLIKAPFLPLYPFHIHIHEYFINNIVKKNENKFDLIHIHTPLTPVIHTKLPVISTVHTSVVEDVKHIEKVDIKSILIQLMTRYISYPLITKTIQQSDIVTTVAYSVATELKQHFQIDDAVVVGNGVNEKIFKSINKKSEKNYILYIGRLSYRKGIFDLLESAKEICQKYPVSFILVGKGELEKKVKTFIRRENLESRIKLTGHIPRNKLIQFYQTAMIFILPSHYEGLPTVLLEAMSCSLPVIATDVSGNVDVIKNGVNGILVPPRDPEGIIQSISYLIENPSIRQNLGERARKTIEVNNTWDIITDRIEKCYHIIA